MADSDSILYETSSGIARITLNRPDRLNSFNAEMSAQLSAALDHVRASDARVLVITGAGRGFCAGQDLSERTVLPGDAPPDLGATIEKAYNPIVRKIRALPVPVIAAVNGTAAGAGANLAFTADIVIAAKSAKFIQAFCKIGLLPDSGGTWWLPRLVGPARAAGLAMLGEPIGAEKAADWGLIWKAVDDDAFKAEVDAMASHLAQQPTLALATIKAALQAAWQRDFDGQLDAERDHQRELGRSHDYREGVAAFMAKRPPRYRGN